MWIPDESDACDESGTADEPDAYDESDAYGESGTTDESGTSAEKEQQCSVNYYFKLCCSPAYDSNYCGFDLAKQ